MNPQKPIILCVDDEAANLKLLEKLLVPRGYEVVGAASGKDALAMIKTQAIDLVLLDIMMPGMDGLEVCAGDAMRSDRPYRAARPEEKARAQVRSLAETHFDPMVVEMFLKLGPGQDL